MLHLAVDDCVIISVLTHLDYLGNTKSHVKHKNQISITFTVQSLETEKI